MLDNVKQTTPALYILQGPFRCTSVDPETGSAQARSFYYKVIPNTKLCRKVLDKREAQYLSTRFGNE